MRNKKPDETNKYYLLKKYGGYALGIPGSNGGKTVLPNCAGYAACRFNEYNHTGFMQFFPWWRNAEYFYVDGKNQGLKVGNTPKVGAIMCWQGIGDKAGHVAFVESVCADGSIVTSESAWGGSAFYNSHRYKGDNGNWGMNAKTYKFIGYIYSPEPDIPSGLIRKGDKGDKVKWLQKALCENGYLRESEIDGEFGKITLGALLAYQFENKLSVDGICGTFTKQSIAK